PLIVAQGVIDMAQAHLCLRQEGEVPEGGGEVKGALGGCECAGIVAHPQQRVRHLDGDVSQPTLVVKGGSKRFGFAQVHEALSVLSEHKEGGGEGVPQAESLLLCLTPIGQMLEGDQRLLKISYGLAVRRARYGSSPSLPAIEEGFVPDRTTHGVVGQTVHLLGQAVWGEGCEGLDQ